MGSDAIHRLTSLLADRYRVERELGAGGMATVYLAHDLRHDRDVAVKVLRPDVASALGSARFLAEIRTTAALQHPHLLPLLDSGEVNDPRDSDGGRLLFYVMPYVSGESLRNRLDRERLLPVPDAVRIAAEVADALDYAHRHGVVHRDIKPANILLQGYRATDPTAEGWHALVADFGVALAASRADEGRLTATGISVGTPQYMSPEQAMGDPSVDGRTDIYALGAVLYENARGRATVHGANRAGHRRKGHHGEGAGARAAPGHCSSACRGNSGPSPRETARRSVLERARIQGRRHGAHSSPLLLTADSVVEPDREECPEFGYVAAAAFDSTARIDPRRLIVAGTLITAIGALATRWALHRPQPTPVPVVRFEVRSPSVLDGEGVPFALSPDGSRLVYVARDSSSSTRLLLRDLSVEQPTPLAGTRGAAQPFFSPDGQWIGFLQGNTLQKVPVSGGAAITICDLDGPLYGASWGPNDVIVFAAQDRLWRVQDHWRDGTGGADAGGHVRKRSLARSASRRTHHSVHSNAGNFWRRRHPRARVPSTLATFGISCPSD